MKVYGIIGEWEDSFSYEEHGSGTHIADVLFKNREDAIAIINDLEELKRLFMGDEQANYNIDNVEYTSNDHSGIRFTQEFEGFVDYFWGIYIHEFDLKE